MPLFPVPEAPTDSKQYARQDRGWAVVVVAEFASVAAMKASPDLVDGSAYMTMGYYAAADGGGNQYIYHETGQAVGTMDDGFYIAGSGDSYFEATEKVFANLRKFGANGDGVADDAPVIQAAVDSGATIYAPPGTYLMESTVAVTSGMDMACDPGAVFSGSQIDGVNLFTVTGGTVKIIGGQFTTCLRSIFITAADLITIRRSTFDSQVNAVYASSVTSAGTLTVDACMFDDMETGVAVQSQGLFQNIRVSGCQFTNFREQTLGSRPSPLDKKIISGIWVQFTAETQPVSVICTGNVVDGVTGPAIPPTKPETHGIAISLGMTLESDCIISSNIVKNVFDDSVDGSEGIMGRGRRVLIEGNTLYEAGAKEGCIYAKGSEYHKVLGNIIEVDATRPDRLSTRGVISTNTNCDVSSNKFINLGDGIQARATVGHYKDNEFVNVAVCINMALETDAQHLLTTISDNTADAECGTFFNDETLGAVTYGDMIMRGNTLYGSGIAANVSGAKTFLFADNYISRNKDIVNASKTTINVSGPVATVDVRNNHIEQFDNSAGDGRVFTGSTEDTPRVIVENNLIQNGSVAFWMRDQTYADYVFKNNQFFNCNPFSDGNIVVTGRHIRDIPGLFSYDTGSTLGTTAGELILAPQTDLNLNPTGSIVVGATMATAASNLVVLPSTGKMQLDNGGGSTPNIVFELRRSDTVNATFAYLPGAKDLYISNNYSTEDASGNIRFYTRASQERMAITGAGGILMHALPTSDPLVANELWNDAGTLKISAG